MLSLWERVDMFYVIIKHRIKLVSVITMVLNNLSLYTKK